MIQLKAIAIITIIGLLHVGTGRAEDSRVVTAVGKTTLKKLPTSMRMTIQFKETGKDITEALKNLKDRRDAATATVIKLGAVKESIQEGIPGSAADDPQAARMMAMMERHNPTAVSRKKKGAAKVTLTGSLSAEWVLNGDKLDDTLKQIQSIKDKIIAAELAGAQTKKKLTPEEMEEMEEMEMMQQEIGGVQQKAGEPGYIFIARISEEEAAKARAAAFQKATRQAEQLVASAGRKLGKLRGMQSHGTMGMENDFQVYGYRAHNGADANENSDDGDELLVKSPTFGKIPYFVAVQAMFDIDE
ncbi:MAG: SIMPL domain-containing protein [Planctomycetaceae bacterium]